MESEPAHAVERLMDIVVYTPLGLALFAKDTVPPFLRMFSARGRAEVGKVRQDLGNRRERYRAMGQFATQAGPPYMREQMRRRMDDARRRSARTAQSPPFAAHLGLKPASRGSVPTGSTPSASRPVPSRPNVVSASTPRAAGEPTATGPDRVARPPVAPAGGHKPEESFSGLKVRSNGATGTAPPEDRLAIPDYDLLAASQVVGRLDGLSASELDAIAAYERTHRARKTILGKINQLCT